MGMPSRVIYLPPGVTPPPSMSPQVQQVAPNGIPFDRAFFQQFLPQAIASFRSQVTCDTPVVELLTVDGTTHYVRGIAGVSDSWVALHTTTEDHGHPVQAFIPYQTIFRVELHPCGDARRPLGFITTGPKLPALAMPAEAPVIDALPPAEPKRAVARAKSKK